MGFKTISGWLKSCVIYAIKQVDKEIYETDRKNTQLQFERLNNRIDKLYDIIISHYKDCKCVKENKID